MQGLSFATPPAPLSRPPYCCAIVAPYVVSNIGVELWQPSNCTGVRPCFGPCVHPRLHTLLSTPRYTSHVSYVHTEVVTPGSTS